MRAGDPFAIRLYNGLFAPKRTILGHKFSGIVASWVGKKKLVTAIAKMTPEDLRFVIQLVEKGQLRVIVDRKYSFSDISNAHEHAQTGHKIGNLVLELAS
ncbi:MAG: zinc-binding dehydrogenase [Bacteroidota bacterium]